MDEFIKKRRDEWKQRILAKINQSKDIDEAISKIIDESLYYSSDKRELYGKLKKILNSTRVQLQTMIITRKKEFDAEWMNSTVEVLHDSMRKLRQQRKKS